jgi:hypothetical protein
MSSGGGASPRRSVGGMPDGSPAVPWRPAGASAVDSAQPALPTQVPRCHGLVRLTSTFARLLSRGRNEARSISSAGARARPTVDLAWGRRRTQPLSDVPVAQTCSGLPVIEHSLTAAHAREVRKLRRIRGAGDAHGRNLAPHSAAKPASTSRRATFLIEPLVAHSRHKRPEMGSRSEAKRPTLRQWKALRLQAFSADHRRASPAPHQLDKLGVTGSSPVSPISHSAWLRHCLQMCPELGVMRTVGGPFLGQTRVAPVDVDGRLWTGFRRRPDQVRVLLA